MHGRLAAFAGALMLGASAFVAHGAAAQDTIGVTAAVNPQATGQPPKKQRRDLRVGLNVVANERIVTTAKGQAQMLFRDESAFTVGPNSDVVLDEFVFDPSTETGKIALSATKGVFRFVGGKISKKTPVTLKTPTSVIGIRGGIALISVAPNGATRATFLFGDSMTVESGGVVKRVSRPGFTITAESADSPPSDPEPATTADLDSVLTALEGGATNEEEEDDTGAEETTQTAATTEEEDDGSAEGEEGDGSASDDGSSEGEDTAGTEEEGGETESATDDGGDGATTDTTTETTTETTTSDVPTDEDVAGSDLSALGSDSEPDAIAPVTETTFEVALADTTSTDTTDEVASDANITDTTQSSAVESAGISIGAALSGRIKRGASAAGGSDDGVASSNFGFAGAAVSNGMFDTAAGGSRFTINAALGTFSAASTSNPFGTGTLSGTGVLRADNEFITYGLTDSATGQRAFAFAGVPTTTFPTTGATFYRLRKDFIMGSLFPFIPAASVGNATRFLSGVNAGIYWDDSQSATAQLPFGAVALGVNGAPASQDSAVSVFIGRVTTVGGKKVLVGKMRGSSYAGGTQHAISGTFDLALDSNGVGFFGGGSPDHFVLQATSGTSITDETSATTSTYHPNIVADARGDALGTRTTQSSPNGTAMHGFATGFVETFSGGSPSMDFLVNFGGDPIDISVQTSAETNKVLATFDTKTEAGAVRFTVGFGDLDITAFGNGLNTTGNSAFFDDGVLAASDRSFGESQVGGGAVLSEAIYMFSVDDGPKETPSGVSPCTCKFLEWGFWGGQMNHSTTKERIHLATWVAGQMSDFTTIAGLSGSATYNGHITGSVLNAGNSYLATGGFSMTVNFGSPASSTVSITNFDGGGFSGTGLNIAAAGSGLATFGNSSTLIGTEGQAGRTADILGGFVSGGGDAAAEVAGRFTATGTGYQATGILAASK